MGMAGKDGMGFVEVDGAVWGGTVWYELGWTGIERVRMGRCGAVCDDVWRMGRYYMVRDGEAYGISGMERKLTNSQPAVESSE